MASFDQAASEYDRAFTQSCVGKAQREQVWKYLDRDVVHHVEHVLEINCGTGADANEWHKRGKKIHATDLSEAMIEEAKLKYPDIEFQILNINDLGQVQCEYDLIFSNFGGLNCLNEQDLKSFFRNAANRLSDHGRLTLVIMGKKTIWDRLYLVLKGKVKERNRRNTSESVQIYVSGTSVSTWYYSPLEVIKIAGESFECKARHPIGLFVPPSYLAPFFERRRRSFKALTFFDRIFTNKHWSNYADHYLIVLSKRE